MADQNIPVTSNTDVTIDCDNDADSSSQKIIFSHDNGTELMRIQEDGKVGIGTASPSEKLHLAGNALITGGVQLTGGSLKIRDSASDQNHEGEIFNSDTELSFAATRNSTTAKDLGFYSRNTGASRVMTLKDGGNVGIGTSSPGAKLDVRGSVIINEDGGDNDVRIDGDTDANLLSTDASADRVGIGTASPTKKLEVNGDAKISGFASFKAPTARVTRSSDKTVLAGTTTAIDFNQEDFDNDVIHDNSTNNTRLTCKTAGVYLIIGNVMISPIPGDTICEMRLKLRVNGGTPLIGNVSQWLNGGEAGITTYCPSLNVTSLYQLDVNDYVELLVTNDDTADHTIFSYDGGGGGASGTSIDNSPTFMMLKVSD